MTLLPRVAHPTDSWDDDYDLSLPSSSLHLNSPPTPLKERKNTLTSSENWDGDFRDCADSPIRPRASSAHDDPDEDWDDENDRLQREHVHTPSRHARSITLGESESLAPLPSPFPRSPSPSLFSLPVSSNGARDSLSQFYSSTTHLALRSTPSTSSANPLVLPTPSRPVSRERRRLRKKSRPPSFVPLDVFELDDRAEPPPTTPNSACFPPPEDSPSSTPPSAPSSATPNQSKSPLLSRIGSVGRKWGAARKKRNSTDPAEVAAREHDPHPRPHSTAIPPPAPRTKGRWFFRTGGGGGPGPPPPHSAAVMNDSGARRERPRTVSEGDDDDDSDALPADLLAALGGEDPSAALGLTHDETYRAAPWPMSTAPGREQSANDTRTERTLQRKPRAGLTGVLRRLSGGAEVLVSSGQNENETTPRAPSRVIRSSMETTRPSTQRKRVVKSSPPSIVPSMFDTPPPRLPSAAISIPSALLPSHSTSTSDDDAHFSSSPPVPPLPRTSVSPSQVASLGRATPIPACLDGSVGTSTPRRSSMGDLKIPTRISQAQVGLRRDLGMVREFAVNVEQLKALQHTYYKLLSEMHALLHESDSSSHQRTLTPTQVHVSQPRAHVERPESYEDLRNVFRAIEERYRLTWECAELLVELGSGPVPMHSSKTKSASLYEHYTAPALAAVDDVPSGRRSRERAITLSGEDKPHAVRASTSPLRSPPVASPQTQREWRASTGRHDLSARQLLLLRGMLHKDRDKSASASTEMAMDLDLDMDAHRSIPEESCGFGSGAAEMAGTAGTRVRVDRSWRWGGPGSTVTLPSEEEGQVGVGAQVRREGGKGGHQKRRSSRIRMRGIRDMLRVLKKSYLDVPPPPPPPPPPAPAPPPPIATTPSTDSSLTDANANVNVVVGVGVGVDTLRRRRRVNTSAGPEEVVAHEQGSACKNGDGGGRGRSVYGFGVGAGAGAGTSASLSHRPSSRRPSIASIFRLGLGQRSRAQVAMQMQLGAEDMSGAGCVEVDGEWQRVEVEAVPCLTDGTVRVRRRSNGKGVGAEAEWSPYRVRGDVEDAREREVSCSPSTSASSLWSTSLPPPPPLPRSSSQPPPPPLSRALHSISEPVRAGTGTGAGELLHARLAMTPENIRPLLENAKEVYGRCVECVAELRALAARS